MLATITKEFIRLMLTSNAISFWSISKNLDRPIVVINPDLWLPFLYIKDKIDTRPGFKISK